jgi:hypothetical protein
MYIRRRTYIMLRGKLFHDCGGVSGFMRSSGCTDLYLMFARIQAGGCTWGVQADSTCQAHILRIVLAAMMCDPKTVLWQPTMRVRRMGGPQPSSAHAHVHARELRSNDTQSRAPKQAVLSGSPFAAAYSVEPHDAGSLAICLHELLQISASRAHAPSRTAALSSPSADRSRKNDHPHTGTGHRMAPVCAILCHPVPLVCQTPRQGPPLLVNRPT